MPIGPSEKPAAAAAAFKAPQTVATDSTGAHNLITLDDTGGPQLTSPDGSTFLRAGDGGGSVGGTWDFGGNTIFEGTINVGLPTADPHVVGNLYTVAGIVHVSAG